MNKRGETPFDTTCKAQMQMRSLIPSRSDRSVCKRPNQTNTEINSNVNGFAWNPEGTEPEPKIPIEKMILVKKVQEKQRQIEENQFQLMRRIALIKEQLQDVKIKIETVNQDQQTINDRIQGCQDCGHLLKLANQKSVQHRNLMRCIEREEKLMIELQKTQREICEARVADQAFSLEMEKEVDGIYEMYRSRQEYLVRKRIKMQNIIEKNARYAHKQTMKEVINSLSKANKINQNKIENAKIQSVKTARNKMKKYFRKTIMEREHQMRQLEGDRESKLINQQRRFSSLQEELNRQKSVLCTQHQIKQLKRQQAEEAKKALRKEMLLTGENPYLHEKIIKNIRNNNKMKAKIENETEEIKQLSQRLEEMNLSKEKEEIKKKKWDQIWAKRLKDKKERELKKQRELYGIVLPASAKPLPIPEENLEEEAKIENEVLPEKKQKSIRVKKTKDKNKSYKREKLRDRRRSKDAPQTNDTKTLDQKNNQTSDRQAEECVFLFAGSSRIQLSMRGRAVLPHQCYVNSLKSDIYIGKIEAQSVGSYQFEVVNPNEGDVTLTLELDSIGPFLGELSLIEELEDPVASEHELPPPGSPKMNVETLPDSANAQNNNLASDSQLKKHGNSISEDTGTKSGSEERKRNSKPGVTDRRRSSQGRRNSNRSPRLRLSSGGSQKSGGSIEGKQNATGNIKRNSRRRSHRNSLVTRPEHMPITPPPFVGPFEIIQDGIAKLFHLREMLEFLEHEKQPVFFQAVPSKLTVKSMGTEKFIVYFIPVVPGTYFGGFKVLLLGNVVHEFNVVGVATPMSTFHGELVGG